mgnify:CR=1 FL=1
MTDIAKAWLVYLYLFGLGVGVGDLWHPDWPWKKCISQGALVAMSCSLMVMLTRLQ